MPAPNPHSKRAKCRTYLEREDYAKMPRLALARVIYKENNLLFKDVEEVRTTLRFIAGKQGSHHRASVKSDEAKRFVEVEDRPRNPYKLPDSDETSYTPYNLKAKRILLLSDIHIPYHSIEALTAALTYGKKIKPDAILFNGDFLDFFQLSRFIRDPKKRSFKDELDSFKALFERIDRMFPNAKKILKIGNHEERYMHFLWTKAKELSGVEEFTLESILKARANGIDIVDEKRIIKAGGLNIIHGHEFATSVFNPVNVARGLYLRGKTSAIQGHNHASSEHTEKDMNDKIVTTWSSGCLCELHPAYMPINKWNHGFCDIQVDGKSFEVNNKRIYKGKVL